MPKDFGGGGGGRPCGAWTRGAWRKPSRPVSSFQNPEAFDPEAFDFARGADRSAPRLSLRPALLVAPEATRLPAPELRASDGAALWQKAALWLILTGLPAFAVSFPQTALASAALGLGFLIFGFVALRLTLLTPAPFRLSRARPPPPGEPLFVTLLLPLYQEAAGALPLLRALERLEEADRGHGACGRLEALILLEQDDLPTRAAFAALRLPDWVRVVVVPPGSPRTKPRALNWGLAQARGAIVGIFDAEDRPDSDQVIKMRAAFARAPPEVVCFQARLGWRNARRNWITRGLALEYAAWFGWLLPRLAARGWPIPLGGTSCYIRIEALRALDGWDAHNVTEDADLGFRIARRGWRCGTLDSTTWEEAVISPGAWIRQRSRWTKGFLMTWIVHMRDPLRLWREIGPAGFWVLNALTLGCCLAYLTLPLHLAAVGWMAAFGEAPWSRILPHAAAEALTIVFWAGQITAVAMAGASAGKAYGARFAPLLPLYLAALGPYATIRAMIQLVVAPSHWEKTAHGVDPAEAQGCVGAASPAPAGAFAAAAGLRLSRG